MDSRFKGRFPNLNQSQGKQVLSFYHDCMLRVFDNHASRKSEYLGNVLLSTAKSGDVTKLCKALEKVDLNKVDFNLKERNTENTPLIIAAECGHDEIIQILLSCGSDVTLRNSAGQTVLENAPERIIELILDSVNRPGAGQPLLFQAAWQGNATVVKKLLKLNPNLNVNNKNSEGLTPLLLVTRDLNFFEKIKLNVFLENYNPTEVVSLLLHQNADCTAVDSEGRSALHLTSQNHGTNARNIVNLLTRKDSLNIDLHDIQQYTALHCASETGDPNILLTLIDNGADVNARGPLGRTPLHVTASRGDEKSSVILVEHGANVLIVDDLGFSPVDIATGNNVQLLLKEAWTEHSQRSVDSFRVKSAPVALPVKLDHLDPSDVSKKNDESEETLKKTSKKQNKKLSSRSHSEEQTQPLCNFNIHRRTRSYSSGPSPRSRLDPINKDVIQSQPDEGRASPVNQKANLTKTNPSDGNSRHSKSPPIEMASRPVAKVAVLNINLKGHDLYKQKSKSCSELPFTRYRVKKLSNVRSSMEDETPCNPLSLRGLSMSSTVLSSFETLPDITHEPASKEVDDGERLSSPDPAPELQIVVTPPADKADYPLDNQSPSSPETDILNKTFNSKDKPVFWFPANPKPKEDPNSTSTFKNSDRGFFVDWNKLETPLEKCTKCHLEFKPDGFKPGTSICNLCFRESIGKDTFWVPFGSTDRKAKTGVQTDDCKVNSGTRSSSVDDRTICIDKETLNILRKKKFSEGSLNVGNYSQNLNKQENMGRTKQILKKTASDTSEIQKSLRRVETDIEYDQTTSTTFETTVDRVQSESSSEQLRDSFETVDEIRRQSEDSIMNSRKLSFNDNSKNLNFSENKERISKTKLESEKQGKGRELLEQEENNSHLKRKERNELDKSLDNPPVNEWQSEITTENTKTPKQNEEGETNGLSVEKVCATGMSIVDETLMEIPKVKDNKITMKESVESAQQENCQPNVVSCKKLEEGNKLLKSLITEYVSMGAEDTSHLFGQFGDQSLAEDYQSANQSTMSECVSKDCGKSVTTIRETTSEPAVKDENVECCAGTVVNIAHEKLSHERSKECSIKTRDSEGYTAVEADGTAYNGVEMDKNTGVINTGREHINTDFIPHQVVIVNPFPSPVPPKVPIVNVTSNCQCDRFVSLAKNSGIGGKKKARGKKTGTNSQKTEQSSRETWTSDKKAKGSNPKFMGKSKKTSCEKEIRKINTNGKESARIVSAGKKSKKKLKNPSNKILKEVSVVQPNLKSDLAEENESSKSKNSDVIFGIGTVSAPVRQATFVKENISVLSPIPEASRSGSSVPELFPDVFPLTSENDGKIPSTVGRNVSETNNEIDDGLKRDLNNKGSINDQNCLTPSHDAINNSTEANSEPKGRNSEIDDDIDELIEEILNETDELEKYHTRSDHIHTYDDVSIDQAKLMKSSENNLEMEGHSKDTLVSNWLREQNLNSLDESLTEIGNDRKLDEFRSSERSRASSECHQKSSGSRRDSSELHRPVPSETIATDTSCRSSGSTRRPHKIEISSNYSNLSDNVGSVTTNVSHRGNLSKLGTSFETFSAKTVSGTRSENWTTSSGTISLPMADGMSVDEEAGVSGGMVHSRISRRKSETSGTSSEITTSEEEEIVWRKGNLLGKGAFGKVYCGLTNTGQMIAVKQVELITSNMKEAERQYEKLQQEVALLKSLRHENIVSYLGTCLDGGVVNIFMQFVPGGSIASILARFGPLEERVFRYYTKQILVGVEYLHQNNVVHRDIKGGNIMLMPTGVIKLIDFGCAKRLYMNMSQSQEDLLRSMKGTPYWMAPEVIKETGYGRKSDIWSIGCTVFEMATGKPPWSHLPPMSAILAIGQGSESPKLNKPNSDDACDFVHNSMARDPDERWSAEELLNHPFILHCNDQR